ncbi:hypothetical protein [Roseococcus suduntuyensis]|uniref:Uncharacterized protein n=1 Tax=Roseococcus suduntuyensis TaxID=455361 RepID=A0A840AHH6_9PROT|nr:hypothetical protein [Roseococcus suduntuyensis]MBB3900312.1 hypothetical protein [Roseococcus suduntuyensis]
MSLWRELVSALARVLPPVLGGAVLLLLLIFLLGRWSGGPFLLGAALSLPLAALLAWMLVEAWRSGIMPGRPHHTRRAAQPALFALLFAVQALSMMGLAWIGAWCLWRLVAPP